MVLENCNENVAATCGIKSKQDKRRTRLSVKECKELEAKRKENMTRKRGHAEVDITTHNNR